MRSRREADVNILFFGDLVGKPARTALKIFLPELVEQYDIQFVGANVENAAGGFGLTKEVYSQLIELGVDVLTSGNHIWDKKEILKDMDTLEYLLRPINYPSLVPGKGSIILNTDLGSVAVINLSGRIFMEPLDCPFQAIEKELDKVPEDVKVIVVDFHAEATSEKCAMGFYLDGRVSAVLGTHTHIPTADERILPNGTAYITDIGMTGPLNSVIGINPDSALERFLMGIPRRFELAKGPVVLNAVVVNVDPDTGRALGIKRVQKILEQNKEEGE